jgi:hypothetical protein
MTESKTSNVTSRGITMSRAGTANPDFNLIDVIDELPAAEFFWYNSVPPEKKPEYCRLLGQLLQLFITPHVVLDPPTREASYLKKYEYVFSNFKNQSLRDMFIHLFYLENSHTNYEPEDITIQVPDGLDTPQYSTITFQQAIQNWYFNDKSKPLYLVNLRLSHPSVSSQHAVLLAIKKYRQVRDARPVVKFMYLDPHGYLEHDYNFARTLKQKLVHALAPRTVQVVQFLLECPELQMDSHGGNCVQHSFMVFTMLMNNPYMFDDAENLLRQLQKHSTLNVLLFSLSIFLRTMPLVHLIRYHFAMFVKNILSKTAEGRAPVSETDKSEYLMESNMISQEVSTIFHMPNCPNLFGNVSECDTNVCARCGGQCQYRALVEQTGQTCYVLRPKEIAETMFVLYFQIKDMAIGIDPEQRSFLLQDMKDELNFIKWF